MVQCSRVRCGNGFYQHVAHLAGLLKMSALWYHDYLKIASNFREAAAELEPYIRLIRLDLDVQPEIAEQLNIRTIPALILFAGSREVARRAGKMTGCQIVAWVRAKVSSTENERKA